MLQGLCGAALVPLSQAVLLDINPPERHGRAMALWGLGVMLGPMLGPVLGGWLTDNYSWRWVFYINVPFGILSALGLMAYVRETETRQTRFDFLGFGALSLAIGALQILLDRGALKDWFSSPEIWIETGIAIGALYLFIVHTLTAREPFVSFALFKDPNFSMGNLLMFIVGVVLFATLALLPPLLQDLLGYPVSDLGNRHGPARLRQLHLHVCRRQAHRPRRRAAAHRHRHRGDRRVARDDVRLLHRHAADARLVDYLSPGPRHRHRPTSRSRPSRSPLWGYNIAPRARRSSICCAMSAAASASPPLGPS